MPEDVETSFLNQTIKVFTKVSIHRQTVYIKYIKMCVFLPVNYLFFPLQIDPASEKNEPLYTTLKAILTTILYELRDKAVDENEDS